MDLADYYRQLGLRAGANIAEVKASYRRLARQYHPDVNPNNDQAKRQFITITEAYKYLLEVAPSEIKPERKPERMPPKSPQSEVKEPQPKGTKTKVTRKEPHFRSSVPLSDTEKQLKQNAYIQLQHLLKYQKFPRAIALVEGLAQRMPQDVEVRQWQAIVYQRWGRQLIQERQLEKARIYLKKALRTDPHNRTLWAEVERDFRKLEQIY